MGDPRRLTQRAGYHHPWRRAHTSITLLTYSTEVVGRPHLPDTVSPKYMLDLMAGRRFRSYCSGCLDTVSKGACVSILIATDGSRAAGFAAEVGMDIARGTGDDVVFIAVWDMILSGLAVPLAYIDPQPYLEADKRRAEEALAASKDHAARLGFEAETILKEGNPVAEVCRVAAERNVRMIVIGSHGWGAFRGFIHGSVVAGVLRYAPCAVLSGPPESREPFELGAQLAGSG